MSTGGSYLLIVFESLFHPHLLSSTTIIRFGNSNTVGAVRVIESGLVPLGCPLISHGETADQACEEHAYQGQEGLDGHASPPLPFLRARNGLTMSRSRCWGSRKTCTLSPGSMPTSLAHSLGIVIAKPRRPFFDAVRVLYGTIILIVDISFLCCSITSSLS